MKFFSTFAASLLLLLTASKGAPLAAPEGVDLGFNPNAYIYGMRIILPSQEFFLPDGWATPDQSWGSFVVSVGQMMGVFDDGSPIPCADLVPLSTNSLQVMAPDGRALVRAGVDETRLTGKVVMEDPQGDISMGIYQ